MNPITVLVILNALICFLKNGLKLIRNRAGDGLDGRIATGFSKWENIMIVKKLKRY